MGSNSNSKQGFINTDHTKLLVRLIYCLPESVTCIFLVEAAVCQASLSRHMEFVSCLHDKKYVNSFSFQIRHPLCFRKEKKGKEHILSHQGQFEIYGMISMSLTDKLTISTSL